MQQPGEQPGPPNRYSCTVTYRNVHGLYYHHIMFPQSTLTCLAALNLLNGIGGWLEAGASSLAIESIQKMAHTKYSTSVSSAHKAKLISLWAVTLLHDVSGWPSCRKDPSCMQ